jgi:expansin (peptidoglycan-binding protein)
VITATNYCPQGSEGGWCDTPKQHFDLSMPMFVKLAQEGGGVVPVNYRRVPCAKQGGVRYQINGNPWFLLVLVTNVGGAGDVQQLQIKGSKTGWYTMERNWGQMWQFTGDSSLPGQALSFRATLSDGTAVESIDCAPSNWGFQQTFEGVAAY